MRNVRSSHTDLPYEPVPHNHDEFLTEARKKTGFSANYEALADEYAALDELLAARLRAGLTQEQVAERMGVKQSALARVEASLGSRKHSPSLTTLRKYAAALGCRLEIKLVPR